MVPLRKSLVLAYGLVSYAAFFATYLYALGFVGNVGVPKSIDSARAAPIGRAALVDGLLLGLFAVQHSVMARPAFKRWWTRLVPEAAERSTYVLLSSVALALLFWLWEPIGGTVWDVTHPAARAALYALFVGGWLIVLYTSFLINHFDLFGLKQVWTYFRGRPYVPPPFVTPVVYRHVRHPLYVGWLLAFWATPTMTAAHLLFAVLTTAYILVAIQLEERDLVAAYGPAYAAYRRRVPRLIPRLGRRWGERDGATTAAPPAAPVPACATESTPGF